MIWVKLASAGILALAVGGAAIFLLNVIKENERLTLNNATLETARKQDAEVMEFLRKDNAAKEAAIQRRTDKIVEMNAKLAKAKREVRTITKTVVTEIERECLLQPVPDAIVEFMLTD